MSRSLEKQLHKQPDACLLRHFRALGVSDADEYLRWCRQQGFVEKLAKSARQRRSEFQHQREGLAKQKLCSSRSRRRNLYESLQAFCRDELRLQDVHAGGARRLCKAIQQKYGRDKRALKPHHPLAKLIKHLEQLRVRFLVETPVISSFANDENTWLDALILIADNSLHWLRPIDRWKPRSHNPGRQFQALLRHLFVQHNDVACCFDSVWFTGKGRAEQKHRTWYIRVGRGESLRKCELPLNFTKKMVHHFRSAPGRLTFTEGLRYAQVLGLGGSKPLAEAVLATPLGTSFDQEEFWVTFLQWLIRHPLLDRSQIGPIYDYVNDQRFLGGQFVQGPDGRWSRQAPQPGFRFRDRSPNDLLRRVDQWHRALGRDSSVPLLTWQPTGLDGFEFFEGGELSRNLKCWTVRELMSSQDLIEEGRKLKHCVATYARSCARRDTSIWTMQVETLSGVEKRLTIEVRPQSGTIVQARGKLNRLPDASERMILGRWCNKTGLKLSPYV